MRALTLWRPWSNAIVHGSKRVENRPWAPPASILGKQIAIHAGKKYGLGDWKLPDGYVAPTKAKSPTGIVRVARVAGYLDLRKDRDWVAWKGGAPHERAHRNRLLGDLDENLWWGGPVGWLLEDVRAVGPIPCSGALGLWRVPSEVVEQIVEVLGSSDG